MSSGKNTHIVNGWKAFSYFCCSAWNDSYLIDLSKAEVAGDLGTQRAQFVPVTQMYKSIDNLMGQSKLYSAFEYPMAPDTQRSTAAYIHTNTIANDGKHTASANDISGNLKTEDASGIVLNSAKIFETDRLDNSFNVMGQGVKSKSKFYDCLKICDLKTSKEYSVAVTPTRHSYFGQNQGNLVANTKPQRVVYVISAEIQIEGSQDMRQMKLVKNEFDLDSELALLVRPDMEMDTGNEADPNSAIKSIEFGNITCSYSYNWDVMGQDQTGEEPKPMNQSGNTGNKYMVISAVPTEDNADPRAYVNFLNDEFYGISIKSPEDESLSFGYISYQSLGDKAAFEPALEQGAAFGYTFPRSSVAIYQNASVWEDNWFKKWNNAYGDLASALQGKVDSGSENFTAAFLGKASNLSEAEKTELGFSRLVNQSAIVNTNHLEKFLYLKTNNRVGPEANIHVYISVLEDWIDPANALDSLGIMSNAINGAAYIPYLDANASRQIVCQDYDIWNSDDSKLAGGTDVKTNQYSVGADKDDVFGSNVNTMVPHQSLDKITGFPDFNQTTGILDDKTAEPNKDLLLFDWRAKTLAQPTFACCELDAIVDLGLKSTVVSIDNYAGSFVSNNFRNASDTATFILDADLNKFYANRSIAEGGGLSSFVADKGTYVHSLDSVFKEQASVANKASGLPKLFAKWDNTQGAAAQTTIFNNLLIDLPAEDTQDIMNSRYTKLPWFTWEGLCLPVDPTPKPPAGMTRLNITKNGITALVSIIRTASLLVSGMVINQELNFSFNEVSDAITTKTLYNAWWNTKEFFKQLSEIQIGNTIDPEVSSDFNTDTVMMPTWLEVLSNSNHIKVKQFFRSTFCTAEQLKKLIGNETDEDAVKNFPPTIAARNAKIRTKFEVENVKDKQFKYYEITYDDINKIEYPAKSGNGEFEKDMYPANVSLEASVQQLPTAAVPNATTPLRGMLRPIMWDPEGTYPNHMLIPMEMRGVALGDDWDKLAYISCDGTLKNSGNVLQQSALNYRNEDESNEIAWQVAQTGRIMFCTPYVPVGNLHVCNPTRNTSGTATEYLSKDHGFGAGQGPLANAVGDVNDPNTSNDTIYQLDMYRHQHLSKTLGAHATYLTSKALALDQKPSTDAVVVASNIRRKLATALKCGPPIEATAATAAKIDISFGNYGSGTFDETTVANLLKNGQDNTLKIRFGENNAEKATLNFTVKGAVTAAGKGFTIRKADSNATASNVEFTLDVNGTGTGVSGETFDVSLNGVSATYEFTTNAAAQGGNTAIVVLAADTANVIITKAQAILNAVAGQSATSVANVLTVTNDTKGATATITAGNNVTAKITSTSATTGTDDENFYTLQTFTASDPTDHGKRIQGIDLNGVTTGSDFAAALQTAFTAIATDVSSGFNSVLSAVDKLGFRGMELESRNTGSNKNTEGMITDISSEILDVTDLVAGNNLFSGGTDDINFVTLVSNRNTSDALNRVEINTVGLTNGTQLASLVETGLQTGVNAAVNYPVGVKGDPTLALASLANKLTVARTDHVVTLTLKTDGIDAQTAANDGNGAATNTVNHGAIVAQEQWAAASNLQDNNNTSGTAGAHTPNKFAGAGNATIMTHQLAANTVVPVSLGYNDSTKLMDMAYNKRRLRMHTVLQGFQGKALYTRNNNMGLGMVTKSDLNNKLVDLGEGYNIDSVIATNPQKDHFVNDSLHRTQTFISLLLSGYGLYSDKLYDASGQEATHPELEDLKELHDASNDAFFTQTIAAAAAGAAFQAKLVDRQRDALYELSAEEKYRYNKLVGKRKRFLSGPLPKVPCINVDLLNYRVASMDELHSKNSDENGYKWVGPSSHFMAEPNTADIWRYIKNDSPLTNRSIVPGRNEYKTRTEAFASAGSGMLTNVKTFLHNGLGDGTDADREDDLLSAIGSAYENHDFNENRPSLFAITRGFDISRNKEQDKLESVSLFEADINGLVGLKVNDNKLCYFNKLENTEYEKNSEIGRKIESKATEIKLFKAALDAVLAKMKEIKPCPDRSSLHFSDHHFMTLPADESLQQALIDGPLYSTNKYLRLQTDMMEYLRKEQTIIDLTNLPSAKSEKKKGGAFVEGMYYVDDLSSSTIRIFYPTPLREDLVRPEKNSGMVALACYVADTCKGISYDNKITGLTETVNPAEEGKVKVKISAAAGGVGVPSTPALNMMFNVEINGTKKRFIIVDKTATAGASYRDSDAIHVELDATVLSLASGNDGEATKAEIATALAAAINAEFGAGTATVGTTAGTDDDEITIKTPNKGSTEEIEVGHAFTCPDNNESVGGTEAKKAVFTFSPFNAAATNTAFSAAGGHADAKAAIEGISGETFDITLDMAGSAVTKKFLLVDEDVHGGGGTEFANEAAVVADASLNDFDSAIFIKPSADTVAAAMQKIKNGIALAFDTAFAGGNLNKFIPSHNYFIFDVAPQTTAAGAPAFPHLIIGSGEYGDADIVVTSPSSVLATAIAAGDLVGATGVFTPAKANATPLTVDTAATDTSTMKLDFSAFTMPDAVSTDVTSIAAAAAAAATNSNHGFAGQGNTGGTASNATDDGNASLLIIDQGKYKDSSADGILPRAINVTVAGDNIGSGISGEIIHIKTMDERNPSAKVFVNTMIQIGETASEFFDATSATAADRHRGTAVDKKIDVLILKGDSALVVAQKIEAAYVAAGAAGTDAKLALSRTGKVLSFTRADTATFNTGVAGTGAQGLKVLAQFCEVGDVDSAVHAEQNEDNNRLIYGLDKADVVDTRGMDVSFNALLDIDVDQEVNVQNHVFGRGGITVHKRNVILESLPQLPNWDDLKDTSGAALLEAFIKDPFKNSTGGADNTPTNIVAKSFNVGNRSDEFGKRTIGINLDINKDTGLVGSVPDLVNAVRYRNFSVLTITGPRDFAIVNNDTDKPDFNDEDVITYNKEGTSKTFKKKRVYSRIGNIMLQGTNKSTKMVIANHNNDREHLSKSIMEKFSDEILDDGNTKNWAIKGEEFKIERDTAASLIETSEGSKRRGVGQIKNSYILTASEMPAYIANTWNKTTPFLCAPSFASSETHNYSPQLEPGQLLRTNFGIVKKFKTSGIGTGEIGLSANAEMEPVEFRLEVHLVKSPGDTLWSGKHNQRQSSAAEENFQFYDKRVYIDNAPAPTSLILRTIELDETEIMNYYKLDTVIFLEKGSAIDSGKPFTQINRFVRNMPENLQQYLGYLNRTVTPFLQDRPTAYFTSLTLADSVNNLNRNVPNRYWVNTFEKANLQNQLYPGAKKGGLDGPDLDVSMNAQYDANQLYFEQNLVDMEAQSKEFDKQLMAWNEGIVGAKIGDMVLTDFDNISEEQVVDTSETLTEIPGFHILMWVEAQKLNATDKSKVESKTIVTPNHLKSGYCLSAGRNGNLRGIYDAIKVSAYEQDLLVAKGAKTIQNEQIITNRNPVVSALASRGSITPEKKYEYGVYKENMYISPYKNSIASKINVPVINEVETITHSDSIGMNTSYCEKSDKIAKNGVLIIQHANVLYTNHNGINITIPSELRKLEDAIDGNKCKDWKKNNAAYRLKFCMVAVPENNNGPHGKTGVNPGNSALVNIVARDPNIDNVKKNQWALCYDECVVSEYGNNTVKSEFTSEIYDLVSSRSREVQRDLQFNMLVDLFRSRNTTTVRTVMTFNKLPRMEQVKTALVKKVLGFVDSDGVTQAATVGVGDAPFLQSGTDFARNYMVISRLKYHVDANGDDLGINATFSGANLHGDRETLYDLFHVENVLDASSNIFTITKLDAARKIKPEELNGANAYKGAPYAKTDLLYGCSDANEGDVSGSILHHYRKYDTSKTGVTGLYVETLIYFTSLLTRPLLDGRSNLTNAFFKVRDVTDGEWDNLPKELFDLNKKFENEMRTYRKTLVSTMIRSMPNNVGSFCTDILNRSVPKAYLEAGKKYNAFAQLEFLATFRDQLMSKKIKDGEKVVTLGARAKFPIYCYLSADGKNILFPSWKEQGVVESGERKMVYEEEIDYKFAKLYYGDEFIAEVLSSETGFGFESNTPFERTKEFNSRLITSYEEYIAPPHYSWLTAGSKDIFVNVKKHLDAIQNDLPRNLQSAQGYISSLGLLQIWTPLLEILFILKDNSLQSGGQLAYNDVGIQPDVVIGSHVNTFKNKFDIQNFQLKLNVVRLDLNLLKECTAFEIKEVEFSDNTLLTLDTLSPVGNPQELFLPIMMKTKAENVETVKSRKVEIKTDYLLETLNDIDVLELMNNIWYRIDERGNRIVLSPTELARVPLFRNYPGIMFQNNYEPVLKNPLTQQTLLEELELDTLKHIDGNDVKGFHVGEHGLQGGDIDTSWTGFGWWETMSKHLGFYSAGRSGESGQGTRSNKTDGYTSFMHPTMPGVYEFSDNVDKAITAGTFVNYDADMTALETADATSAFAAVAVQGANGAWTYANLDEMYKKSRLQTNGASLASHGKHRQRVMPKQCVGGFVRSCWLAERLASVIFGKQNFPSFAQTFSAADPIPFNDFRGPGTAGKLGSSFGRDYFKKSSPIMQLIADSQYGRLKLADVRSDDSARGELADYRYPGIQFDISANTPIFAESVPNTNGAFACQVIRMIKSGLIGRPEDEKIFTAEQDIADQINGGVYQFSVVNTKNNSYVEDVISGDIWRHMGDHTANNNTVSHRGVVLDAEKSRGFNFVFNPQQFMYFKLQEKKSADQKKPYKGGFVPMQFVLQQLLSNDPQRFELNEKEASRHSDFVQRGKKDYNKSYTQWRSMVVDNPLPELDVALMTGDNVAQDASQWSSAAAGGYTNWEEDLAQNKAEELVILPAVGRGPGWNKSWWAAQAAQDHPDAHPLALCIRGLDLDHCTMTYKDLSDNTLTPYSVDPWGEFLMGESGNAENEDDFGSAGAAGEKKKINAATGGFPGGMGHGGHGGMGGANTGPVDAYLHGLKRGEAPGLDVKAGNEYPLYGPALHLTEGNHPILRASEFVPAQDGIEEDAFLITLTTANTHVAGAVGSYPFVDARSTTSVVENLATTPNAWRHQQNIFMKANGDRPAATYAGWNSYIEYTDLTKVYPIYMLPLMESDKISIVVTNEGSLKDPLEVAEGAEGAFDAALKEITDELKGWSSAVGFTNIKQEVDFANINNTAGTGNIVGTDLESNEPDGILSDYQESVELVDYPSITGTGMNRDITAGNHPEYGTSKGLFNDCVNILVAPELGPYEKYVVDEWRYTRFGKSATVQCENLAGHRGEGTVLLTNHADLNTSIKYKGNDISKNSTYFVGLYGNNTGCNNSIECLYYHIGMRNYINPGGASGVKFSDFTPDKLEASTSHIARTRARYLAHDLSNVPVSDYYQKLVTRSFTIKYGLTDERGQHEDYNDIRIRQLASDQVSAFEVKDVKDMPKIDIFDKENAMRYDFTNYSGFWAGMDDWVAEGDTPASDVDQQMIAKPVLITSSFSEVQKAFGAFLIPRRFDGRPMDPNVPSQNIICIRKDNMRIINAIKGEETREPTQKQLNEAGNAGKDGKMRFSLDLGVPLQGGGLIRCKLPLESAGADDYAVFTDEAYNKDYLVFKVRDWIGNKKPDGTRYPTIKKQNIMANLHDAINRSQIAQLNERLLEPYISAVAVKKQPPPNSTFDMPVLLPSKPDGAVIEMNGQIQPRTFFQPLNLILNPTAAGEDHFELRPVNHTYYIRISADNKNWWRYVQQARHFGNSGQASTAIMDVGGSGITAPNNCFMSDNGRVRGTRNVGARGHSDASHPHFKNMAHPDLSFCIANDISGIIHDAAQTQLLGTDASGGGGGLFKDYDQNPTDASQATSIYSLDLLALLNCEYIFRDNSGSWVHRLSPAASAGRHTKMPLNYQNPELQEADDHPDEKTLYKVVEPWHVVKLSNNDPQTDVEKASMYHEFETKQLLTMKPTTENTNIGGRAILVISDIGKRWVDYEGLAMGRDRYFRLSSVLDQIPYSQYALAIDDIGGTDVYHGDLADSQGAFDHAVELDDAAEWDPSNVPLSVIGGAGPVPVEGKNRKRNNPIEHLFRGCYITMDDPTTGAAGIGDWTNGYSAGKVRWGQQDQWKHFNNRDLLMSTNGPDDVPYFPPGMYDYYDGSGAIALEKVFGVASMGDPSSVVSAPANGNGIQGANGKFARAEWTHTHHPSDIIFANLTTTQRNGTEIVEYFESAEAATFFGGEAPTEPGGGQGSSLQQIEAADAQLNTEQTRRSLNMNYVREIQLHEKNYMNQFGIEADKVAAFTLYGAFLPPGYAPDCSGIEVSDDGIIEMKFRDKPFEYIKCRPDYKDGAASNDYAGRYGKSYNFVRKQTHGGADGYALFDGLFDNMSLLYVEMYGKSTHLKSEGMADNSRFRWAGSNYCKGQNTVSILKSPHYEERLALKNASKITHNVLKEMTVPDALKRKRLSFSSVRPGVAPLVFDDDDNNYYVPSLWNKYQVKPENTFTDIAADVAAKSGGETLPSLRTFKLQSFEPDEQWNPGAPTYKPKTAWMTDENQARYWRHIEFFGTRPMPVGKTKHEAEGETEAPSERELYDNEDVVMLQ